MEALDLDLGPQLLLSGQEKPGRLGSLLRGLIAAQAKRIPPVWPEKHSEAQICARFLHHGQAYADAMGDVYHSFGGVLPEARCIYGE
jgi:hypothetical protein